MLLKQFMVKELWLIMIFQSFFNSFCRDFLVIGKVVVMIQVMLKEEFLKMEKCHVISIRGKHDFVWCAAADKRLCQLQIKTSISTYI
jgi:hypothetical protein